MPSFMLIYTGPPTAPGASHEGWPEWFASLGDRLVDKGSPMTGGFVISGGGTTTNTAARSNGYSIIRAEDRDEVRDLLRDHPLLAAGSEYSIEVFGVPAK